MFTIDLLNGKGIPIKKRPWGVAIAALAFMVPVVVAVVMFGFYLSNRIVIKVARQEIITYEKNIEALADSVELHKSFEAEKNKIGKCISEVTTSVARHTQWSPVLVTVVKNIPSTMVLTNLEVKRSFVKKNVPKKDDPKTMVSVTVPVNRLQLSISGRAQADNDKAVKGFMDNLRISALLAPKLEDILVSQKAGSFEGQEVVSYEIDCIFKPEL